MYPIIPTSLPAPSRICLHVSAGKQPRRSQIAPRARDSPSNADYQSRPLVPSLGLGEMFDLHKGYRRTCFSPRLHKKRRHQPSVLGRLSRHAFHHLQTPSRLSRISGALGGAGSSIIAPNASYIVEPVFDREELIVADLDLSMIDRECMMNLDVSGYYARPDVFTFSHRAAATPSP